MPREFSDLLLVHQTSKMLKRAIVCFFGITGKATPRHLATLQVILQTLTADALSSTRFVAAVAFLKILFSLALHHSAPHFAAESLFVLAVMESVTAAREPLFKTP
jgi:hypothetical protein